MGTSLGEGEPRAASMGLILFGSAGVLTLVLTWRLFLSKAPQRETASLEAADYVYIMHEGRITGEITDPREVL